MWRCAHRRQQLAHDCALLTLWTEQDILTREREQQGRPRKIRIDRVGGWKVVAIMGASGRAGRSTSIGGGIGID